MRESHCLASINAKVSNNTEERLKSKLRSKFRSCKQKHEDLKRHLPSQRRKWTTLAQEWSPGITNSWSLSYISVIVEYATPLQTTFHLPTAARKAEATMIKVCRYSTLLTSTSRKREPTEWQAKLMMRLFKIGMSVRIMCQAPTSRNEVARIQFARQYFISQISVTI